MSICVFSLVDVKSKRSEVESRLLMHQYPPLAADEGPTQGQLCVLHSDVSMIKLHPDTGLENAAWFTAGARSNARAECDLNFD